MIVKTTGTEQYDNRMKLVIAGPNGSGRLRSAVTFPHPFVASAKANLMSIADKGVPFTEIESEADLVELIKLLKGGMDKFDHPIETLIISSIDELQRILVFERLKTERKPLFSAGDWQWLSQKTQNILSAFASLDLNIIYITHTKAVQDGETGKMFMETALQGAANNFLGEYVDYVFYLHRIAAPQPEGGHEWSTYFQTSPDGYYDWLKDDSGTLPEHIELDFENDYDILRSYIDSKKVPETTTKVVSLKDEEEQATEAKKERLVKAGPKAKLPSDNKPNVPASGAEPKVIGYGTNLFCDECGEEVMSDDLADRTFMKVKKILCLAHEQEILK